MSDILQKALEEQSSLCHHGVLGMKWGVRRYQNKDGSLTKEGKKHYSSDKLNADGSLNERGKKMLQDISDQNYGPGNIFKNRKLSSAARELNSNETNRLLSQYVVNSEKAVEIYWNELATKYGMDPEDEGAGGSNAQILKRLSPSEQAYVKERLNAIAILENSINNYADHLAGQNATPIEKSRIQDALNKINLSGVLDLNN